MADIAKDMGVDPADIEIWFTDEVRIGQKTKVTRRWARRGTRPSAPHDQRTASAYIFGAICPRNGKGAALAQPACNTEVMSLHLAEIAREVAPRKHAVLLLDQAGWHLSSRLVVPTNITCCLCRRNAPNSIRRKILGSPCVTIGCRTASSNPTTTSSTTAATPGTDPSSSRGASCPSD